MMTTHLCILMSRETNTRQLMSDSQLLGHLFITQHRSDKVLWGHLCYPGLCNMSQHAMTDLEPNCDKVIQNETNLGQTRCSETWFLKGVRLRENLLKADVKSPRFVPIGANLAKFQSNSDIPDMRVVSGSGVRSGSNVISCSSFDLTGLSYLWIQKIIPRCFFGFYF